MTPPPRTRRVWAGLATFAACIGAVVLLISVHDSSGDPPSSTPTSTHAPTSFYSSAAGDWTASPTARNLLGTGCQCNVQIVGGFNGSKGDTGKFETGGELLRAQLLNPNITGVVDGGATHVGATLRSAVVETGLGFKVGAVDSTKTVTVAPPDAMTIAGYTVKLPSVAPAANEFLQSTDGTNTKWSNTLAAPTITDATIKSATYTGRWRASGAVLATSPTPLCTTTATSTGGVVTITDPATCVITQQMTGGIIHWDGEGRVSSLITMRISATTAYIVELEVHGNFGRPTPTTMRLYAGSQSFSASYLHTTMQAPLFYTGDKSVVLSLAPMSAGASATWSFPPTAATDTLVGTGAAQTLTDKTLAAPKLTGLASLDGTSMLTIDPKTVACTGDQTGSILTVVATTGCDIAEGQIGSVIVWANGDRATIVDVGPASQTATLVGGSTRASSAFTLHTTLRTGTLPTTQISNDAAVFKDRITFKTRAAGGTQAVTIDASNTEFASRHHAKWSFPHPGTTGPWVHRFVGADTAQTLTAKTLDGAKMSGTTAFQAGSTITGARFEGTTTIVGNIAGQPRFAGSVSSAYPSSQSCEMNTTTTGVVALKTGSACQFSQFWVDVGTIIRWQDNTVSVVTRRLDDRTVETIPVGTAAHVARDFQFGNVHWGSWMFSAGSTHTTMQAPTMYGAKAGVRLSLDSMKDLQMATWSFPKIDESTRPSDTFVGASTAQTLTNKKVARLAGDNTVAPATQAVQAAAGTGATASIASFSNAVAGTVTVAAGTAPAAGTIVVLSFAGGGGAARAVTLIAANAAAATVPVYVLGATEAGYSLASASALAAGSTYSWHYHVIG